MAPCQFGNMDSDVNVVGQIDQMDQMSYARPQEQIKQLHEDYCNKKKVYSHPISSWNHTLDTPLMQPMAIVELSKQDMEEIITISQEIKGEREKNFARMKNKEVTPMTNQETFMHNLEDQLNHMSKEDHRLYKFTYIT